MSSANVSTFQSPLEVTATITAVCMLNSTDYSEDPRGEPEHIFVGSEIHPADLRTTIVSINAYLCSSATMD